MRNLCETAIPVIRLRCFFFEVRVDLGPTHLKNPRMRPASAKSFIGRWLRLRSSTYRSIGTPPSLCQISKKRSAGFHFTSIIDISSCVDRPGNFRRSFTAIAFREGSQYIGKRVQACGAKLNCRGQSCRTAVIAFWSGVLFLQLLSQKGSQLEQRGEQSGRPYWRAAGWTIHAC